MSANVKSVDTIRQFRVDVANYRVSLRQSLDMLTSELKRAVDYFESDRSSYWPAQARKASDRLAQARIDLERCQVTTCHGEGPSCYEEKKALERAKQRLQYADQKVKVTRHWVRAVRQAVDAFQTRLAQLNYLTETELPRATMVLDRLAARLDRYTGNSQTAE